MAKKTLRELFHDTLKDIYFAEKKILGALPKMTKAAQAHDLKAAFQKHEAETKEHVARLEKVFAEIDQAARGKTAGLLAAAQAVEHYEISRYGTLKTWASELGLSQAVKLLDDTLSEEKKTNDTLTKLAESGVNEHAQAVE
jgi:ferritin-like metal-binding protein YciE